MAIRLDQRVQPSPSPYYWWQAYGPFDPGEDEFPHVGQVIRHYRIMRGMEIEELARRLNISVRRAYELEETVAMPKSISRRQAVADILSIPFALLNLPRQTMVQPTALQTVMQSMAHTGSNTVIHSDTMQAYEDVLDLAWETYYTSNAQRSARTVNYWQQYLLNAIHEANGISQDQLIALHCRFLQLGSVIARDRLDTDRAITDANKAVELAFQLKNAELIAASLYRRAKIHVEKQEYDLARKDVEGALPYAGHSHDPLRCYVSVFLAEIYSLAAPADKQLQRKSLVLLDDVGRTVRAKGVLEGDGSYAKVDLPGLYMIRADVLLRHGNIQEAQDALIIVSDNLPPEFTRWRGNLRISEAQLAYAEKDIDGSCHLAIDALSIVEATRSRSNRTKIERLYTDLSSVEIQHSSVRELGTRLGLR